MQLPLPVSALVMLGVGAVLVGALILVVVAVRRRKPASGPGRIPPDMRMPQQPVATSGPYAATAPTADPSAPFAGPAAPVQVPVAPVSVPTQQAPAPAVPPVPQPLAGPVAAAATPRPMEVSSRVDQPGGEQVPPERTPPPGWPVPPSRHQAGSGRTVAAAVAQAFAVRAAAGRGGASGPGMQQPAGPPPPDERADASVDDSAMAAQEFAPSQPDPVPDDEAPHVPPSDVDSVDPAATTDPDGLGLAAAPGQGSDDEPRATETDAPEAASSGNGWSGAAAYGSNGDHASDGNGQPPEGWQAPEPGSDGHGPAAAAAAGLLAAGWTVPAAPVQADPEPAAVPAPRPDNDGVTQQDGSASDARDRLLAVLLDDPERAVGATVELETCLRELDRLSDAVRTGRAALRDVLHRLASAGLRPEQLARLAQLPQAEVEDLLEAAPAEQQA
jgi:hypothetical protein